MQGDVIGSGRSFHRLEMEMTTEENMNRKKSKMYF